VSKLVRDDAGGKAERVADLMQVITELTNECFFGARLWLFRGVIHRIGR
jgi:hypothetical protein